MECWIPKLPHVGPSDEVVGHVTETAAAQTGLRAGTPVVRGAVDMCASALASDLARSEEMNVIAGTFSIAATLHERAPKTSPLPMLQFPYPRGGWMSVQGSATSASNLEWVVNTVLAHGGSLTPDAIGDPFATVNAAVQRAMGRPSDTLFLPYLFGGPDGAPAGLVGMTAQDTFDDLMLAVFEGIVFAHKSDIDIALSGADAAAPSVIRLTGGASRSPVWSDLFADILGLPVEVPVGSEFGAKGVAICAAAAVGAYDSLDLAVAAMTGIARRHAVDEARAHAHRAKYPRFRALATALASATAAQSATAPAGAEPVHA
jgi:L-xylulokinase